MPLVLVDLRLDDDTVVVGVVPVSVAGVLEQEAQTERAAVRHLVELLKSDPEASVGGHIAEAQLVADPVAVEAQRTVYPLSDGDPVVGAEDV